MTYVFLNKIIYYNSDFFLILGVDLQINNLPLNMPFFYRQ